MQGAEEERLRGARAGECSGGGGGSARFGECAGAVCGGEVVVEAVVEAVVGAVAGTCSRRGGTGTDA